MLLSKINSLAHLAPRPAGQGEGALGSQYQAGPLPGIRVASSPVAIKHVEKDRISDCGELPNGTRVPAEEVLQKKPSSGFSGVIRLLDGFKRPGGFVLACSFFGKVLGAVRPGQTAGCFTATPGARTSLPTSSQRPQAHRLLVGALLKDTVYADFMGPEYILQSGSATMAGQQPSGLWGSCCMTWSVEILPLSTMR